MSSVQCVHAAEYQTFGRVLPVNSDPGKKIQIDAHLRRSSLLLQSHLCTPITSGRKICNRNKKGKCKDNRTQKLKRPWLVMQWWGKKMK